MSKTNSNDLFGRSGFRKSHLPQVLEFVEFGFGAIGVGKA